jgi:hypothetical protein
MPGSFRVPQVPEGSTSCLVHRANAPRVNATVLESNGTVALRQGAPSPCPKAGKQGPSGTSENRDNPASKGPRRGLTMG